MKEFLDNLLRMLACATMFLLGLVLSVDLGVDAPIWAVLATAAMLIAGVALPVLYVVAWVQRRTAAREEVS